VSHPTAWVSEGKRKTIERKRARRNPGSIFYQGPPVAPVRVPLSRKPFGAGILRSLPTYRLDCTFEDESWWAEEARREEDRMIDRLGREYEAQQRMEMGLDA
jgi:hypothetical protein